MTKVTGGRLDEQETRDAGPAKAEAGVRGIIIEP